MLCASHPQITKYDPLVFYVSQLYEYVDNAETTMLS